MMKRETAFKLLLALVGVAHLALGLAANFAPPDLLGKVVAEFYGATLDVTPQSHHVVRIVGAFMVGIGAMAFLACCDPQRNQAVILGIIVILAVRVVQRLVFAQELISTFNIPPARLWLQVTFFLLTAVALFVLRPRPESAPVR